MDWQSEPHGLTVRTAWTDSLTRVYNPTYAVKTAATTRCITARHPLDYHPQSENRGFLAAKLRLIMILHLIYYIYVAKNA